MHLDDHRLLNVKLQATTNMSCNGPVSDKQHTTFLFVAPTALCSLGCFAVGLEAMTVDDQ